MFLRRVASSAVRITAVTAVFVAACSAPAQTGGTSTQPAATQPPAAGSAATAAPAAASSGGGGNLIFFSTQFAPVEEQAKMQNIILKDAPVKADFIPSDIGPRSEERRVGKECR